MLSGGGTAASAAPIATAGTGDIHYPKYDLYGHNYKYAPQDQFQYTTKYGEDCHFNNQGQYSTSSKGTDSSQYIVFFQILKYCVKKRDIKTLSCSSPSL